MAIDATADSVKAVEPAPPVAGPWFGSAAPAPMCLLSLCPLLAVSTSLLSAFFMSAAFVFVLCATALSISFIRRAIAPDAELACLLIVAATWTTTADLLLQAGPFPMRAALGMYVPLIAVNGLLLAQLGESAFSTGPFLTLRESLSTGMRVAAIVIGAGILRELAAAGSVLSDAQLIGWDPPGVILPVALPVMASPAGAFFALAILVAVWNRLWPL